MYSIPELTAESNKVIAINFKSTSFPLPACWGLAARIMILVTHVAALHQNDKEMRANLGHVTVQALLQHMHVES